MENEHKDIKPEENQFSKHQVEFEKTIARDCAHNCSGECALNGMKCVWIFCPKTSKK
jgi:hypothetical protein